MFNSSMRRALLTATLLAVPSFAFAQTSTTPAPAAPSVASPPTTSVVVPTAAPSARRASTLIGANIINEENRNVGEVHDLMVDTAGGATIAVLSVGGFLGMGERYVAIPLSALRWNGERERWMLPGATVDSLKARPAFTYPERR
ncbi:PRC-barrel domain-containing protein [Neoroseomonas lacus]|uniref:PRC-barrel domain-containing protein n=1 Tax=Neoroseomonas lacus TaxID=287609 RepID=UPI00166E468B|nr:PRC-barrel domain-containing protein [Neoroseomonas lacus]